MRKNVATVRYSTRLMNDCPMKGGNNVLGGYHIKNPSKADNVYRFAFYHFLLDSGRPG